MGRALTHRVGCTSPPICLLDLQRQVIMPIVGVRGQRCPNRQKTMKPRSRASGARHLGTECGTQRARGPTRIWFSSCHIPCCVLQHAPFPREADGDLCGCIAPFRCITMMKYTCARASVNMVNDAQEPIHRRAECVGFSLLNYVCMKCEVIRWR
jgi:hypothetical protein